MRSHAIVLLLWMAAGFVRCINEITVKRQANGILLTCGGKAVFTRNDSPDLKLEYKDENSGEYECVPADTKDKPSKIYVKFRTCDNCIELDVPSLSGIVLGNVVATVAVGVAVYLTVSHTRGNRSGAPRKSSDKQQLFPSEVRSRPPNDHYQPLNHKGAQRDMYDVLNSRR